jgi:hypothetical protein
VTLWPPPPTRTHTHARAGWQLLAEQVKGVAAARHAASGDSDDDGDGDGDAAAAAATTLRSKQGLHVRSLGNTSNLSEESGLGGSGASCVTPRPHQWLYKEYKILDEIGSGGFGRVCRCGCGVDGVGARWWCGQCQQQQRLAGGP